MTGLHCNGRSWRTETAIPLPHEADAIRQIAGQHRAALDEMGRTLAGAVVLVDEAALRITKGRGIDRHVIAMTLALFTKACKTHRATQRLCASGLTSDADALVRVLFETTVALHFILKSHCRTRSRMYGTYSTVQTLKAAREWQRTKGMKRGGRRLVQAAEHALNERAVQLGPHLAKGSSDPFFGKTIRDAARAWSGARGKAVRAASFAAFVGKLYAALKGHWSGRSLEAAAKAVGLSQAYQSLYRYSSGPAHAADFASHVGVPDDGDDAIIVNLLPDGADVPRIANVGNLLLWLCAKRLNERLGLGQDSYIEECEPPAVKALRLANKTR